MGMCVINMEYDYNQIFQDMKIDSNFFQVVGHDLMLTNHEIEVLNRYKIDYSKCFQLKEILFEIDEVIHDMDIVDDDLEMVAQTIAERDYYQNTNK